MLWAKREGKDIIIQELSEATRFVSYQECHNALGHPSVQVLSQAMNDLYLDSYLIPKPPKNFHCSACSLSKSTHQVPSASYKRAENPFELIHTDLSGKFSIPSIGKRRYYITFIDDKTRYSWIAFLSQKSDTARIIQNFIAQIDRQYNSKIQRFRSDNGHGEYIDTALQEYFRNQGCYTPQGVYPASLTPSTVSVCQDRKDMAVIHRKSLGAAEWS